MTTDQLPSQIVIQGPLLEQGLPCEPILCGLPDWFGIEESIQEYVREMDKMPTFLACQGEAVVGFLSLKTHNQYSSEIYVTGIKTELHRQGIGKRLVQAAETYLRANEIEYLQVKTLSDSHPDEGYAKTRAFYQAVGFRPLEELSMLWEEDNPCLLMVKRL